MIAIVACEFHSYGRKGIHLRLGTRLIMLASNVETSNAATATCQPCLPTGNKLAKSRTGGCRLIKHLKAGSALRALDDFRQT
jgi:hypothetical protein